MTNWRPGRDSGGDGGDESAVRVVVAPSPGPSLAQQRSLLSDHTHSDHFFFPFFLSKKRNNDLLLLFCLSFSP